MAKYRKLPVEIEAFQFGVDKSPEWFDKEFGKQVIETGYDEVLYVRIETLEGVMRANYKDYIIKGIQGEIYPCKEDIFKKTYEKVK